MEKGGIGNNEGTNTDTYTHTHTHRKLGNYMGDIGYKIYKQ